MCYNIATYKAKKVTKGVKMDRLKINFDKTVGKIKPMNAVNNGPAGEKERNTGNFEAYKAARFSYARLHDASFYYPYGGEFSVDVHRIFRDFDADVDDESAYIFAPTDEYLKNITDAGTKIFYRLGASIEHGYKYGTFPPKDYLKWAQICERIIRHYTEGWANGFYYDIEYWEIWNEADCTDPGGSNPCWQGTQEEFIDFYCVTSTYLKSKFPHLKIGGPSVAWIGTGLMGALLPEIKARGAALDFFSFHKYSSVVSWIVDDTLLTRKALDENGFYDTEIILNEWNYIKGWGGKLWEYSLATEKNLKGASFALSVMCTAQVLPIDMLMYYDARPNGMNGLFTHSLSPLKTYYVYNAFADLKELGNSAQIEVDGQDIYAVAATNGKESAVLLTFYNDDIEDGKKNICLEVNGANSCGRVKAEIYLLNEKNNMELVKTKFFKSNKFNIKLKAKSYESYMIKFKPEK